MLPFARQITCGGAGLPFLKESTPQLLPLITLSYLGQMPFGFVADLTICKAGCLLIFFVLINVLC